MFTHHVRNHEALDGVVDTDRAQRPHQHTGHHRGDRGQDERAPPAPTPAARVVRRRVHQRQVRNHELERALRTEPEPRKSRKRVDRQGAVGPAVFGKMNEGRGHKERRDKLGRHGRQAADGVDGRPVPRCQIGGAVSTHERNQWSQVTHVKIVDAHRASAHSQPPFALVRAHAGIATAGR